MLFGVHSDVAQLHMEHTGMTRGLEVTDDAFGSAASIVFDQTENRQRAIKAILIATLG